MSAAQRTSHGSWNHDRIVGQNAAQAQAYLGHSHPPPACGRVRDLAMFNTAIDSKLRGCDRACRILTPF